MRFARPILLALSLLAPALAQDAADNQGAPRTKHEYQSDVARLRKIVIESLYSHRDVFLRELISNANDAIEKLRLVSLTDKTVYDGSTPLNITIRLQKDDDKKGGRLIITDTGIGMTPQELQTNLGTLAKSGTSEFLAKAESDKGNLIGAFGLGFYSSFLVADQVYVASLSPATTTDRNPVQHVFSSNANEPSFEVYPDPRGNTLERGTEITLILKQDAIEYLEEESIKTLVAKHSAFSTSFPIYLFTQREEEVPVPEEELKLEPEPEKGVTEELDEEEAVVEDATEKEKKEKPVSTKKVVIDEWVQLNSQAPLWTREPKDVTDEEYKEFYKATFKDFQDPLAWHHFKGDSGSVSFKAIIFIPSTVPEEFWQSAKNTDQDVRLMVKRVFITKELGEHRLPKWISWLKVIVDADDLPLNVSRETLQSTKFLKQLKGIIIKRYIQLLQRVLEDDPGKFNEISKTYNNVAKLGAIETQDKPTQNKIASLVRFDSNQRENIGLDAYVEQRKEGQNQIFFLANVGQTTENLKKSVFIEKLTARGYEVWLLTDPMDEIFVTSLRGWKNLPFQDIAKKGLKYGDENPETERKQMEEYTEQYKPLLEFFTKKTKDLVKEVIISNRLVTSPCAIVVDAHGYSANMEKLLATQGTKNPMHDFARKQRVLEVNPQSPLIEGLLKRIKALPSPDDLEDADPEAEAEMEEVTSILIDGALVRSGFEITNSNVFFERIDRALRRSLGVSETAQAPSNVVPAPPVATGEPEPDPEEILKSEEFMDWQAIKEQLAEPDLEKLFDKTPDENDQEPPKHEKVEKESESQAPQAMSTAPDATATAAHDEL